MDALVRLLAATLLLGTIVAPLDAAAQWHEILPEKAVCSHSVIVTAPDEPNGVYVLTHGTGGVSTLSSVLGRRIVMGSRDGRPITCTIVLEQLVQPDFTDVRSMTKRPVIQEALTARCEFGGGTGVEFGSNSCVVGIGWEYPGMYDGGDSTIVCIGRNGRYSPGSAAFCDSSVSLTTFKEPPSTKAATRTRPRGK